MDLTFVFLFIFIFVSVTIGIRREFFGRTKVKPRVATCNKCMYVVKTRSRFRVNRWQCFNPGDRVKTNFVTGKKTTSTYSCDLRNSLGDCSYFKKRWYR